MQSNHTSQDFELMAQKVLSATKDSGEHYRQGLGMIASENILSPMVKQAVNSDLHGRYAEGTFLQNMQRIIVYFGAGRSGLGTTPQALWLFKDSFIVPLERRVVSPLITQMEWQ